MRTIATARQRKLHVGHFAFMRSVVQVLDPRDSWESYFRVEGEACDQLGQVPDPGVRTKSWTT